MEDQKKKFDDFCRATFIDVENKGSKTITRAKGQKIIALLSKAGDRENFSPKFKHWVTARGFQLVTHSGLGLSNVLCLPAKRNVSHITRF